MRQPTFSTSKKVLGAEQRPQYRHHVEVILNQQGSQRLNDVGFDLRINQIIHEKAVELAHQEARRFGLLENQVDERLIFGGPAVGNAGVAEGRRKHLGSGIVAAGGEVAAHLAAWPNRASQ